ncbi:PDZ domain-containing protein [Aestuariibaculum lutulentum]|uniref:Right-handed parallel beta-helix repeat-containing protein n=1 Tax=Aestuariibaculum lutulentum TaxID=2920935 RepID=A0ABS9RGW4_9FLAO|nr:PDZ domain-containing protein [Aestuariibaculum lutulentum]MCH4551434.1 right-handed parallel beta-helix repeat-containing protein [Aestuariibaculum lutulentum]
MIKKHITPLFILCLLTLTSCHKQPNEIFVSPNGNDTNRGSKQSPIQTIQKALDLAKAAKTRADDKVTIKLLAGDYYLTEPLTITPELNNLEIIGEGTNKVNVKGSKIIKTKWSIYKDNIWVTEINENIEFNQLFINGKQQILARYPNYNKQGGAWQGHAADAISKERVNGWSNPIGGFVHAMHSGRWGGFHYEITGISEDGDLQLTGGHQNNRPSAMHQKLRMVENIFEELDSENEWYYSKQDKKLYLWIQPEIDLNTAQVEVSVLKHLIDIKGSLEHPVKNILISDITFQHAKRTFMEEYEPLLRSDWTIYRGGAITMNGTEHCSIEDCTFTNLGGNVIFVNGYNLSNNFSGNHIYNCGASAISFVGDASAVRSPSFKYEEFVPAKDIDTIKGPANNLYPSKCIVENNLIHDIGTIEKQVAGVQLSMSMKIHIKNNSIYDVPRAGINANEGTWGGHIIEYNDVFNTVLETSDHGAFNSWGRDRFWHPTYNVIDSLVHANPEMPYWDAMYTTVIRNNRFRCDHGWDIDLDDGSSNYHIYNNLCLNGGIKLREGFYRVIENNIMVNNGFHPHVWFDNSEDVFKHNISMTKHFPIRLKGWGKEVDYNVFPDSTSLALANQNYTDKHSVYGNPMFINPGQGDFNVSQNSIALQVGFKNFPMDQFGVQKPELKALAKQPNIPQLKIKSIYKTNSKTQEWLGATLKNIETPEEQSASGLFDMNGVIVLKINSDSKLIHSGLKEGDVIVGMEEEKVKHIADFLKKYNSKNLNGKIKLRVVRNQKPTNLILSIQ